MIQGLYAAASGMVALEDRQAVIANNIANASTPGFRRQTAVEEGFYSVFSKAMMAGASARAGGPGGGLRVVESFTDGSPGPVTTTGNPLDVAIAGPGFLAVDTPSGERYTRNGQLTLSADGLLSTAEGYAVLDVSGNTINCGDGGRIEFTEDGEVKVNGQAAGRLRLVEFEDPHGLNRVGHHLYGVPEGSQLQGDAATTTQIVPESIEGSNVQIPAEIIQMMLAVRAYAANQQIIGTVDETASQLINQVGMPA